VLAEGSAMSRATSDLWEELEEATSHLAAPDADVDAGADHALAASAVQDNELMQVTATLVTLNIEIIFGSSVDLSFLLAAGGRDREPGGGRGHQPTADRHHQQQQQ